MDDAWQVTVPTFRARDVTREIDLVEEVARVVLDRVPHTMPLRRAVAGHLTPEQRLRRALEDVLVGMGFAEAYTWSLTPSDPSPDALRLPDPMSGDHAVLRTTLLHGLVEAARVNVDAGNEGIRALRARPRLPSRRAGSFPRSGGTWGGSPRVASRRPAGPSRPSTRRSTSRSS